MNLEIFKNKYKDCKKCVLYENRTQVVFGEGCLNPLMMIIGQCPGKTEDRLNKPFQGDAGEELNIVLEHLKIDRKSIWISNALLCYLKPGLNVKFKWEQACSQRLIEEIKLVNPIIIVTLGAVPMSAVCKETSTMKRDRQKINKTITEHPCVNTYHPAHGLYSGDREGCRQMMIEDFKLALQYAKPIKDRKERMLGII